MPARGRPPPRHPLHRRPRRRPPRGQRQRLHRQSRPASTATAALCPVVLRPGALWLVCVVLKLVGFAAPVAAEYHADAAQAGPAARLPTGIPQPNKQAQARRPPIRWPARTTGSKTIWRMARTRDSCRNGGSRPKA
ncbi:hypothetical protein CBM2637_A70397 [Cupriavidus taiwanensis]|nr:hypothetical protein CBM2637_A70397 [Cupriavidus taiwanensis]